MNETVVLRVFAAAALTAGGVAWAHVTPPVALVSQREAVSRLLDGAQARSVRDVRLTDAERARLERETGSNPGEVVRFHLGRDGAGVLVAAVVFVTEYTMHGPVRVAVGLDADGRVKDARVVEVSEEAYPWIRRLIEHDFVRDYVGQDAHGPFAPSDRLERAVKGSMPRFYGRALARLLRRAALLFDVGIAQRGEGG